MSYKISKYTGAENEFPYKHIQPRVAELEVSKYCSDLRKTFALQHTKRWSSEKQTEWLTRHYLAVKMIMTATILLTSRKFAGEKNLKIVEPYLLYYSCVCSCKALIYTLPTKDWEADGLAKISHAKVINICVDSLAKLSRELSAPSLEILQKAKAYREIFSYRFPALGLRALAEYPVDPKAVENLCAIVSEVAQMNRECLESSIKKNVKEDYEPAGDVIRASFAYSFLDDEIEDDDDYHRIGYYLRKSLKPRNLLKTATEGMIEDYFGAWVASSPKYGQYDPEANMQILFPFV